MFQLPPPLDFFSADPIAKHEYVAPARVTTEPPFAAMTGGSPGVETPKTSRERDAESVAELLRQGIAIAEAFEHEIVMAQKTYHLVPGVLKAIVIAESPWSRYDLHPIVSLKRRNDPEGMTEGITQLSVTHASEIFYGKATFSPEEISYISHRLVTDPEFALQMTARHIKDIEVLFEEQREKYGYSIVPSPGTTDYSRKEISEDDVKLAIIAGYNLGVSRLDGSVPVEVDGKVYDPVRVFVEMSRHNYVTGVSLREVLPADVLTALSLPFPSEQEKQWANEWKDTIDPEWRWSTLLPLGIFVTSTALAIYGVRRLNN